jgi:hypothetical protein
MRPVAERHGLTLLQLACAWNLAHPAVTTCVPTLIQEPDGRAIEDKRAELAATPATSPLTADEVAALRAMGDNNGHHGPQGRRAGYEGPAMARPVGARRGTSPRWPGRWGSSPRATSWKTN